MLPRLAGPALALTGSTPAEFVAVIDSESRKGSKVVRDANAKPE